DHAADAELRSARRPDGTEGSGGQEGDQRLGDVGEVGGDPVAPPDPEADEAGPGPAHLLDELGGAEVDRRAGLGPSQHGRTPQLGPGRAPQDVLGVVQGGAVEPAGAGHGPAGEDPVEAGRGPDVEEVPDRQPEGFEVVDRPLPEITVGRTAHPPGLVEPAEVPAGRRGRGDVGRRAPQDLSGIGHQTSDDSTPSASSSLTVCPVKSSSVSTSPLCCPRWAAHEGRAVPDRENRHGGAGILITPPAPSSISTSGCRWRLHSEARNSSVERTTPTASPATLTWASSSSRSEKPRSQARTSPSRARSLARRSGGVAKRGSSRRSVRRIMAQ